jgi:hypothetical protein
VYEKEKYRDCLLVKRERNMLSKFPLSVYFSALKVALVVGTILLLINQYDALFFSAELRWFPAILTYCVPFTVFLLGQRNATEKSTK